jgi:hypothetical protein
MSYRPVAEQHVIRLEPQVPFPACCPNSDCLQLSPIRLGPGVCGLTQIHCLLLQLPGAPAAAAMPSPDLADKVARRAANKRCTAAMLLSVCHQMQSRFDLSSTMNIRGVVHVHHACWCWVPQARGAIWQHTAQAAAHSPGNGRREPGLHRCAIIQQPECLALLTTLSHGSSASADDVSGCTRSFCMLQTHCDVSMAVCAHCMCAYAEARCC